MDPNPSEAQRAAWIEEIAQLPGKVRMTVASLPPDALDKPYRDGGWTGRQVVHHLADSHIHSYVRFKHALTEDQPTIKPYNEATWAELEDARTSPIDVSIALLEALHARWVEFLRSLSKADWSREFIHPEFGVRDLTTCLALYAWHGRHHVGHLELLR
jgi:hypothetical protein